MKNKISYLITILIITITLALLLKDNGCIYTLKADKEPEKTILRFFETEQELLSKTITNILINSGFNGNIYISREGSVLYENSIGFKDFRTYEPLEKETVFQLASITKTFTATAILLLQQDSLLKISDNVNQHIPEFPFTDITIKHLLLHTSGLQNYMYLIERHWNSKQYPTNEDVLNLFIERELPLNFKPGEKFQYSNSGYVFLALIIERVSEKSYAEFIEDNIFNPLNLNSTFVYDLNNPKNIENRAFGYTKSGRIWRPIPDSNIDAIVGDKGIFSNIDDLLKWDKAFTSFDIISPEIANEAFEFSFSYNDSIIEYGYGWRLQDVFGIKAIHHPGRWRGFRTSFKRFPEKSTTLIILSNNNNDIADIVDTIQSLLFREEREEWLSSQRILEGAIDDVDTVLHIPVMKHEPLSE